MQYFYLQTAERRGDKNSNIHRTQSMGGQVDPSVNGWCARIIFVCFLGELTEKNSTKESNLAQFMPPCILPTVCVCAHVFALTKMILSFLSHNRPWFKTVDFFPNPVINTFLAYGHICVYMILYELILVCHRWQTEINLRKLLCRDVLTSMPVLLHRFSDSPHIGG